MSSYYNWIDPARRDIASLYVQDIWDIRPELRATLGARYDHYDDFGASFNPRVGLSWQASPALTARLAYGHAFRAPSFVEQYVKNNPTTAGNPDLVPEQIDTWETGLRWSGNRTQVGLTLFRSNIHKLIDIPSTSIQYQNLGNALVYGIELEGHHRFQAGPNLSANVSFADPDFKGIEPPTRVARHHLNLTADIPLPASMHWNIHARWRSAIPRTGNDVRPSLDSVWLLNTALTASHGRWDFSTALYNLTDANYAFAAPANTLPGNYTAPGRSIVLGAKYGF